MGCWMDGLLDGLLDGRVDGWVDGRKEDTFSLA